MAGKTGIEWTDATWSPVRVRVREDAAAIAEAKGYASLVQIAGKMAGRVGPHCEHVSPGCSHCYAETNNHRCLPANGTGLPYDRRSRDLVEAFVDEAILLQPLRWKRPRKIFVENQSDIFGEWVTDEMLDRVFAVMALCPQHTFQVLTKRPERMLAYLDPQDCGGRLRIARNRVAQRAVEMQHLSKACIDPRSDGSWPLPNVWLGVSAENQKTADERIPLLLQTPAAVRFVSVEPMLGPINLQPWLGALKAGGGRGLDWVICGGESGSGVSPLNPAWVRSLRDQCVAAGVPFFFKQWGQYSCISEGAPDPAKVEWPHFIMQGRPNNELYQDVAFRRVVGKAAGHLLDGVEWHQFPEVLS